MVGSGVRFGVLPLGTLNHFAKDLGIPLELDEAVRNLATGLPRQVDVGEVNGRIFLNNSSLGLYPDIVRDREEQQRRLGRGKWPAALWATLAALRRYPFLSMRLTVNGETLARRTPFVFIGNNRYTMEGLAIGERDCLDDGLLSLYVAQHPTRLGLLRFASTPCAASWAASATSTCWKPPASRSTPTAAPARGHRRRGDGDESALALPGAAWRTDGAGARCDNGIPPTRTSEKDTDHHAHTRTPL
jgi:hypothetical protein